MRFPTLSLVIRQSIGAWAKPNSLRLAYTISKVGCGLTVASALRYRAAGTTKGALLVWSTRRPAPL